MLIHGLSADPCKKLIPTYDMYTSSVYTVFGREEEGDAGSGEDDLLRCFHGVIWDREVNANRNKGFDAQGWAKPTGIWWNLKKSLVWQKIEFMMDSNPTQDGTTFLDKVKTASDQVKVCCGWRLLTK